MELYLHICAKKIINVVKFQEVSRQHSSWLYEIRIVTLIIL